MSGALTLFVRLSGRLMKRIKSEGCEGGGGVILVVIEICYFVKVDQKCFLINMSVPA